MASVCSDCAEQFDSLNKFYARGAGGAIIAFDVTSRLSFERVDAYIQLVREAEPYVYLCVCIVMLQHLYIVVGWH